MFEKVLVVTNTNEIAGSATKDQIWKDGLYHRIVRIMLVNENGNILIQQRSPKMEIFPSRWTDSASGHVDAGENNDNAANRELTEELGIQTELTKIGEFLTELTMDEKLVNTFNIVYLGSVKSSLKMVIDHSEVQKVKWVGLDDLRQSLNQDANSYTPYLKIIIDMYFDNLKNRNSKHILVG